MAENAPPMAGGAPPDGSRGMPYYEKLRRDLREALNRKRQLDREMTGIEESILKTESQYLEETTAGNIIKGFDNYIKGSSTAGTAGTGPGTSTRRKPTISETDRIFSKSSTSLATDQSTPNSAQTTPSHAPTPTSSFPKETNNPTPSATGTTKSSTTKKKKHEKDEDEDGKTTKRGKISYGRD